MEKKENNEITVKIKCELQELFIILEQKGFNIIDEFTMDDTYFIPFNLEIEKMSSRDILKKAVIVRYIVDKTTGVIKKKITFKRKEIDNNGNILNQEAINCDVKEVEDAKRILEAIGYKKLINIKERDIVYAKNGFELAIKDVENGEKLIEIETEVDNPELNNIEKLKQKISEIDIPIYTANYFVKKAEIELDKLLGRNLI